MKESRKETRQNKKLKIVLGIFVVLCLICSIGAFIYVNDYYKATELAMDALQSDDLVTVRNEKNKKIIFEPTDTLNKEVGMIFYPGGKVQYEAYAPLMRSLAENGVTCILVHMPANLAVLDVNAADGLIKQYPEITRWYLGGHSLGGAMAASYISKHVEEYEGLLLLGAYSTADLSETKLDALSIYGTNDKVLNKSKYEKNQSNLPSNSVEEVLDGGCHAYFGSYGVQKGDGTPTITEEEQRSLTVKKILDELLLKSIQE